MFGKLGKKSKKISKAKANEKPSSSIGVLSSQKPQRSKKYSKFWKISLVFAVVIAVALTAFILLSDNKTKVAKKSAPVKARLEVTLHASMRDDQNIDDKTRDDIAAAAGSLITASDETTLAQAARILQGKFLADSVHVIQTGPSRVSVLLKPRTAIMRVKADQTRLFSQHGQVYGIAKEEHASLPMLSGLFDTTENIPMRDNHVLSMSDEQQTIAGEALQLLEQVQQNKLEQSFDEIRFVKFRGFALRSSADDLEVTIGRAPFDRKISSLDRIMGSLKKRGSQAQRIELDYDGKAFIKEKRL